MKFPRSSGILLHPTSLPGRFGIGELGPQACAFADALHAAGQKIWQVLPLNPTGYGDSPYQCFSAFAGNPLLISLEELGRRGVVEARDLANAPPFPEDQVDYGRVMQFKLPLLHRAGCRFLHDAAARDRAEFDAFCDAESAWLDDYALFMAAKEAHHGAVWNRWDAALARRTPEALAGWRQRLAEPMAVLKYWQFEFFRQWSALQDYCRKRDIRIMGDVPIYVAHDSADVWARSELFWLDADGSPDKVAGVPPDYFSATGQLWGNPIYRWDRMRDSGYRWWIERFRAAFRLYDMVRLDHFRGFEAYWEVPAGEPTAIHGRWIKGPGAELFGVLRDALGELPIVAENLGVITPEVEAIRRQFGFPGMAILQFAFGTDPQAPSFRPHNYTRELAAYTGTHDNDPVVGWWNSTGGDSCRTTDEIDREKTFARAYLGFEGGEINWAMIRTLLASVADTAIVPMQDVLGLDAEARMNLPARPNGNWKWRMLPDAFTPALQQRLKRLVELYDR